MPLRFRWMDPALTVLLAASLVGSALPAIAQSSLSPGYAATDGRYSPAERAGREIWFFATAFNDRFYTYSYPQRLGAAIDWYLVLWRQAQERPVSGLGRDPRSRLLRAGRPELPGRRAWTRPTASSGARATTSCCSIVGKEGYRDPACDFQDAPVRHHHARTARSDQRQSACDLRFGTSTGALGLRKFPNPRFDRAKWRQLNGSLGYLGRLSADALGRCRRRRTRASTGCSTARSSRRSASAWPAAPATSPTIRCNPPADPEPSEMGEHRRAGRQPVQPRLAACWPRACRRAASNGS